jgi:hypothetical protein
MAYISSFTGQEIDSAIQKSNDLKIVNNGWIRLYSTETNPYNLNNLINPGNYSILYWENVQEYDANNTLINVTVSIINNLLVQFAEIGIGKFVRFVFITPSGINPLNFSDWTKLTVEGGITPSEEPPFNPTNLETIWLDISNPNSPIFKLYVNDEWVSIGAVDAMLSSVYDTTINVLIYLNILIIH